MKSSVRRTQMLKVLTAIVVLAFAAVAWVEAVEYWIGVQLRMRVADLLVPSFDFDDLIYSFPNTITLHGARLASRNPGAPREPTDILTIDTLTLLLTEIPRPNRTFRMQKLVLERPVLRLVRIPVNDGPDRILGFSHLLKESPGSASQPAKPPARPSALFEVRRVTLDGGRVEYDPQDGTTAIMVMEGIDGELLLKITSAGFYGLDLSLSDEPIFTLALRATLRVDEKRLEIEALSSKLQLAREQDHYLTPPMQKLVAARDITGSLSAEVTGIVSLDDDASSNLQAHFELIDVGTAAGNYGLALDRVDARFSIKERTVTLEEFSVDAMGGHATVGGYFELNAPYAASLHYQGADLQIGDLLRNQEDPGGVPSFEGLLTASGTLLGPLAEIGRSAGGEGRLSLRKARLGRIPVLSTIDEALDATAEKAMKRERKGHDSLSIEFSFDNDRTQIEKLRLNSRWYGLRGRGDIDFDSRLSLKVAGGPVERLENELGAMGDVLGEITQTLLRATVSGTLLEPKVDIEILRQPLQH